MNATVTISLTELDTLRAAARKSDLECARLREQVIVEQRSDPEDRVAALYSALQLALPVVRFAVANLPVEMHPGWPYESLRDLGEALRTIPGATQIDNELGLEFVCMSREIAPFEQARARGERLPARRG